MYTVSLGDTCSNGPLTACILTTLGLSYPFFMYVKGYTCMHMIWRPEVLLRGHSLGTVHLVLKYFQSPRNCQLDETKRSLRRVSRKPKKKNEDIFHRRYS